MCIWVIIRCITAKFFERRYFALFCPLNQGNAVKSFDCSIIHTVFKIPLDYGLMFFVEILLDIPNKNTSSSIPLIKPKFNFGVSVVLGSPAFCINGVFGKDVQNDEILFLQPQI